MGEEPEADVAARPGHVTPRRVASAIVRSLVIAVASTAAGVLVGRATLRFTPVDENPCTGDLPCAPDLLPLILAVTAVPVVMALIGPVVAFLLRVARPWLFAVAALWPMTLACVGLGAADDHTWPYSDPVTLLLIMWIPYPLIGLWILRLARE